MVETAIAISVLMLLLVGVEELGRAAYTATVAANAAHAGALYGAQNGANASDNAGMEQAAVKDNHHLKHLAAAAKHACTCADGGSAPDCSLSDCPGSRLVEYAEVDTTVPFTPLVSLPGFPNLVTFTGHARIPVRR